jgi:hypothetical protein
VDDPVQHKNSKKKKRKKKGPFDSQFFFSLTNLHNLASVFFLGKPNKTRKFDGFKDFEIFENTCSLKKNIRHLIPKLGNMDHFKFKLNF